MKKLFLAPVMLLLVSKVVAQLNYDVYISGGLGAANTYTFYKETVGIPEENALRPAFSYQGALGNSLTFGTNSIHLECSYIRKANNLKIENDKENPIYKYRYDYLIIPLYYRRHNNPWMFNIGFINNIPINRPEFTQIKEFALKDYHPGLMLGAGFKLSEKFQLELNALIDLAPYQYVYVHTGEERYTNYGGLRFGYNFMLTVQYNLYSL